MRCIVCHNPKSGWGNHSKSSIKTALELAGIEASFKSPDDKTLHNLRLCEKVDFVIAAGGDGTVAQVLYNLADLRVPVAILPLGTANNIARSLDVHGSPIDLAPSWRLTNWRPLNIGVVVGPWGQRTFVESFGVGVFAKLIRKGDRLKSEGAELLKDGRRLLAKLIKKAKPIDSDGFAEDILAFEATSIAYGGPGLNLAPRADAGDHLIDVVTLPARNRGAFLEWLDAGCSGAAPVATRRAAKTEFVWRAAPYRIDDQWFACPRTVTTAKISFRSQSVKVLVRSRNSIVEEDEALRAS